MTIATFTSREFNQDVTGAKDAALNGPTFITNRGEPTHVLLSIGEYQEITHKNKNIVEILAMSEADNIDIDFCPPKAKISLKPAEF